MDHEGLEDVLAESLAMLSEIVIAEEQHPEFQRYFQLLCEKYKHLDGFLQLPTVFESVPMFDWVNMIFK